MGECPSTRSVDLDAAVGQEPGCQTTLARAYSVGNVCERSAPAPANPEELLTLALVRWRLIRRELAQACVGRSLERWSPVVLYALGPRSTQLYVLLRQRLISGSPPVGGRLPSLPMLAAEFGVAPLTMRRVVAQLEADGLVERRPRVGTFARRPPRAPAVLIVDSDEQIRDILRHHVAAAGHRALEADSAAAALALLAGDEGIALVLVDIGLPTARDGIAFIRTVRRAHPMLSLVALTGHQDDLAALLEAPECPVLVIPKPFRAARIAEMLQMTIGGGKEHEMTPVLSHDRQASPDATRALRRTAGDRTDVGVKQ